MDRQFVFSFGIGNLVRELDGEVRRITRSAMATRESRNEGKQPAA